LQAPQDRRACSMSATPQERAQRVGNATGARGDGGTPGARVLQGRRWDAQARGARVTQGARRVTANTTWVSRVFSFFVLTFLYAGLTPQCQLETHAGGCRKHDRPTGVQRDRDAPTPKPTQRREGWQHVAPGRASAPSCPSTRPRIRPRLRLRAHAPYTRPRPHPRARANAARRRHDTPTRARPRAHPPPTFPRPHSAMATRRRDDMMA